MAKRLGMVFFAVLIAFQPYLVQIQTATAQGSDDVATEAKLLDGETDLSQKDEVDREEQFELELAYQWSEQSDEQSISVAVPEEIILEDAGGEIENEDGQQVGTYQVENQTITLIPEEEDQQGVLVLQVSWNGDLIEEIEEADLTFHHPQGLQEMAISFEPVMTEEEDEEEQEAEEEEEQQEESDARSEEDAADDEEPSDEQVTEEEEAQEDTDGSNEEENEAKEEAEVAENDEEASESEEPGESALAEATQADTQEDKYGFNLEIGIVTDLDGNAYGEENLLDPAEEFWLGLSWNLENDHNYVDGDTETFELPNGIAIADEITGELENAAGQVVATYTIGTDKQVDLTFTDFVETHSNVEGWLEIISTLDAENVEIDDGDAIIEPIGEEGEIRIPIDLGEREKTIEKEGTPNSSYNADEITWEVIINKDQVSLDNATVTDVLPEGTEYQEGSLNVVELDVDLNGNVIGEGDEVDSIEETFADGELNIPLGDIQEAYRIEYVTTVTDHEEAEFQNNATLSDDDLDDTSANATVTIDRGDPINKTAVADYDPVTGMIEWEIEFNYDEQDLEDVTLSDSWTPEGALALVEDSLVFTEMEIDEDGNAQETGNVGMPDGAELQSIEDGFEVTGITTDNPYKVTYQTEVTDRVLDGFNVENTAGFGGESAASGTGVGTYYGAKSAGTIDYAENTIDWTIRINHDEYPMENITIEDTLGEGLTLDEDSVAVTVGGSPYTDYTLSGENPFTIAFPEDFTTDEEILITYQTDYVADELPDNTATNHAAITWTPEGEENSITRNVEAETELNWQTEQRDWKNGSYDPESKEITWTIYTNYRENTIEDLTVTDAPQGNQTIIADSVEVTELAIGSDGGITEGDILEDVASVDEGENTLHVDIGDTNNAYKIEYRTSLEGLSDIQSEYVNEAEVLDGDETLSNLEASVGIAKSATYGDKSGYQDGKQVHWSIDVNLGQQEISNLTLEDSISDNQAYLEDTITVYHASVDVNGNTTRGDEVSEDEYELTFNEDDQAFTIEWNDTVERPFIVEYSTLFFAGHGEDVTNSYDIKGDNIIEDGQTDGDGSVTISQTSSGGGSGEAGYLVIDKVDTTDDGEEKLAGAEFDLIDADTGNVLKTGTTDDDGQIDFGRLLYGDYVLHETTVPDGYVTPEESRTITIDEAYDPEADITDYAYTVENYEPVFAIELAKVDDLGENISGVEFELYNSDDDLIATGTTDEEGNILFEDLPGAGTYYLEETDTPIGYEPNEERHYVEVGEEEREPAAITVENQRELTDVSGTKTWDDADNQDGIRPDSITVNLLADGEPVDSTEVTAEDDWAYSFTGLPQYDDQEEITYTVEEEDVGVDGYTSEVDGHDITNSYTPEVIDIGGEKIWGDADNQDGIRPDSITVNLLADGEPVDSTDVTEDDNWEYSFTDLPKYEAGEEIEYTITENTVEHYTQDIEGYDITNHYTPEETAATVTKNWDDANDQDGIRPESIDVQLTANGDVVGDPVELSEENDWNHTWDELPLNEAGEAIDYSVVEETDVSEYEAIVDDDDHGNIILTNAHTPEEINISGEKIWEDGDNQDGIRPDSVTVNLLVDDETIDSIEVTEDDNWEYSFTDLPKYEAGEEIDYRITEDPVEGYETAIEEFDVTNRYTPEVTEVTGEKTWDDADNQDGVRPESVTVNLLADGAVVDSTEVTEEDEWAYSFTDLPKYEAGEEIVYTVTENTVEHYTQDIDGHDITNHYTPEETAVTVTKSWDDAQNQDGIRPNSIEVQLTADGEEHRDPVELSVENDWTYTWDELDANASGEAIDYSVEELTELPGYDASVNDDNHGNIIITNAYTPEETDVSGMKTWDDADNQDGVRPESVTVNLLADGAVVDSTEVTEEDEWAYSFTDLPKYEAGEEIAYTVTENTVEHYTQDIDGHDITNHYTPEETAVTVTKNWDDANNQDGIRPESIEVQLTADGEAYGDPVELSADNDWTYTWDGLDAKAAGEAIDYSVVELTESEYEASVNDDNHGNIIITNAYTPEETEVSGTKTWKDGDNDDRPDSITVKLLADGAIVDDMEVTEEDDWEYRFTDLPKYEAGEEIDYSISEKAVEGYETAVNGYDLTNTLITDEDGEAKPGKPTDPEKDETKPDQEDKTDKTTDAERGDTTKEDESDDTGGLLPDTATNLFNMLLVGVGLLIVGLALTMLYRKRRTVE
ncbi:Cna B-type domain-containing protein [Salicibibacter cibarius]|uniref:Cna B-type domain-containing protein n=1 Tax=Salicibibacter cibarius TaxID=2743000 RepID=A0A7T6Z7A5_9BACI|nr:Cna B-type domain-containing protein [Salicibibacter cibarius]QQK78096.1 Cna B-type domain-containing protein [Salicibibacter cibarius]